MRDIRELWDGATQSNASLKLVREQNDGNFGLHRHDSSPLMDALLDARVAGAGM